MARRREAFRPCIDLHDGAVKQIVGGTLKDSDQGQGMAKGVVENFVSEKPPAFYAELCAPAVCLERNGRSFADKEHSLLGGHVIKLGDGNEQAALEALRAWPGGMQIGGGITPESANKYLEAGASHVIVTSYVFRDGELDQERLDEMVAAVGGKDRLVLDLSCRKGTDGDYYVVTDRWQNFTSLRVDAPTLSYLATYCDEFLVHGVDVEGLQTGLELPLLELLGAHAPIPVTYAGGARSLEDCETVARLGQGRVGLTIGSALDIFGGALPFADVVEWHNRQQALGPPPPMSTASL